MNETPDTLRGWLETCDLLGDDPIVPKDDVLATADAWEADLQAKATILDVAEVNRRELKARINVLEQRLEAAVELLERNGVHRPDLFPALAAGESSG